MEFLPSHEYGIEISCCHDFPIQVCETSLSCFDLGPYDTSNNLNCHQLLATFKYHQNFHKFYPLLLTFQPLRHQRRIFFNYY